MMNKLCFEAFDRTLRDIMKSVDHAKQQKLFGGKVVILGGDFRQILLLVKKRSIYDVRSTINYSKLWKYCKVLKLIKNMRLNTTTKQNATNIKEFAYLILKIGDRDMDLNKNGKDNLEIPKDFLIENIELPLLLLVQFVYPEFELNMMSLKFFDDGAILCPTIESV